MARRNLLAEAQVTAAAQVAPQVAALSEALRQARVDRNSAIHAAAAANAGIAHAIHVAGSSVKKGYTGAQALAAPGQSYSGAGYSAAAGREQAVGTTALASSLGNALKELSDRRISAAAGRAYATQRALGDYQNTATGLQSKRQSLAAQQGLLTGAAFSKLTESAAGRKNQRLMQDRSLTSQANLQSQRLDSQASLQSERLASQETVAGARLRSSEHTAALGRRQQKLGRQNQRYLQDQRLGAAKTQKAKAAPSAHSIQGRQSILAWKQAYDGSKDMSSVAADARSKKVPETIIRAAANLSSKGYIAPRELKELSQLGVSVPQEWTGVQVKPHVRRRRSK